jgi:hypothetical protein
METSLRTRRLGGLLGIVAGLSMIPSVVVGTPGTPTSTAAAAAYYEDAALFLSLNGWLPVLHLLTGMLFLGALASVFSNSAPRSTALRTAAIGGGFVGLTLSAAGLAAEIAYPVGIIRFPELAEAEFLAPLMLSLATWLYHFCQVGNAVLMIGTAVIAFTSGALPKWFAYVTIPFIVVALLHTWVPLPWLTGSGAIIWMALVGVVLLVSTPKDTDTTVQPATS